MKVIFLDVDGVLNIMGDSYRTFMKPYGQHIEPHLVQRLNYLMKKTETHIVVSSSWKANMDDLELQMKDQGFKQWDKVIGRTPFSGELNGDRESGYRGNQIKHWLDNTEHEIESYVVLEDEPLDVCGEYCNVIPKEKVIHVDMADGLKNSDVMKAIEVLNK